MARYGLFWVELCYLGNTSEITIFVRAVKGQTRRQVIDVSLCGTASGEPFVMEKL